MKFIVDAMFGNLARWLRMSGYDTLYDIGLRDGRIVMIAKEEGRAVITRDKEVYSRAINEGVKATFVTSLNLPDQLGQLEKDYGITFKEAPASSRCPHCNSCLQKADKKDIKAKVPEKVGELYNEFWICNGCDKVYWHGGHWKNIKETVGRIG